jgi:hypothetical protein
VSGCAFGIYLTASDDDSILSRFLAGHTMIVFPALFLLRVRRPVISLVYRFKKLLTFDFRQLLRLDHSGCLRPEIVYDLINGLAEAIERAGPDQRFPAYIHSRFLRMAVQSRQRKDPEHAVLGRPRSLGNPSLAGPDVGTSNPPHPRSLFMPTRYPTARGENSRMSYISPAPDSARSFAPEPPNLLSNPYGALSPTGQTASTAFCSPVPMPAALTLGRELGVDWQTFASLEASADASRERRISADPTTKLSLTGRRLSPSAPHRAEEVARREPDKKSKELAWEWEAYSRRIASETGNFWQGFR